MSGSSRRRFLKAASATAAALAVSNRVPAWAEFRAGKGSSPGLGTFRDRRYAAGRGPRLEARRPGCRGRDCTRSRRTTRQEILGFGAAMTDASCYLLSQLRDGEREALMHELVCSRRDGPECLPHLHRLQRLFANASTASTTATSPILNSRSFRIDHDKAYILPVLARRAQTRIRSCSSSPRRGARRDG